MLYWVFLLQSNLSGKFAYIFSCLVAFLNEMVKIQLRSKMGFNRILPWLLPVLMSLFLVTGCGDLEPEMQDTRTVILKMDFNQKSSSRSSSSVSATELSQYNTHLILALPSGEVLTSNYKKKITALHKD